MSARPSKGQVEFAVADDGPGIPAEFQEKVFELFKTLKPRDTVEGSGMGLALVRRLVERQGGAVRIESEAGEGTTIVFTWPATWRGLPPPAASQPESAGSRYA